MEDLSKKFAYFEIEPEADKHLDFNQVFGNSNPVHLEIGSGRGEFLIQKARQNPDVNYLAIELKEKRIKTIMRKLDFEDHKNVRVIRLFVDSTVTEILAEESFEKIFIIHPDPWPKKRHNRRRIINQDFIDVLWKLLKPDGIVRLSTDHPDYAIWIVDHFSIRKDFGSLHENGFTKNAPEDHLETYFEKMKKAEGFPPFFMEYKKVKILD
ncbi:MAG: tRNA (guanosine(46)-N7)-methyltransferase TrmB [Candidatus Cloacimonetes bacterium]|nr:tRNA (guanosine(46)-N7)-methyltransferase TrmB [Candidatus Cloacimonadota bacterium]MCF7813270.1 tRNA (guanosine(46)-N7)-methyltransferase TrmB [Candidatus Cloacimonadota bacterium]MCF7867345.1 tRNA (guanosine(46)-N7)-methyltransferase TrmB [Candidatus Cloacimonadota bacterium]MCF7882779.1 tRNA (guanosine(46)-N7)-methyltransferase TrmB [Candidatus Cloacimonadota bacterium]